MGYTHLTQEERYQIAFGIKARMSLRAIAKQLSRHPSTISREVRGNGKARVYQGLRAHQAAQGRAQYSRSASAFKAISGVSLGI